MSEDTRAHLIDDAIVDLKAACATVLERIEAVRDTAGLTELTTDQYTEIVNVLTPIALAGTDLLQNDLQRSLLAVATMKEGES